MRRKMKKKVLALVLSVGMCFAITACGDKETGTTNVEPTSEVQESVAEPSSEVQESVAEPSSEEQESVEEPSSEEAASTEEADTEGTEAEEADTEGTEAENAEVEIKVEIPDGFSEVTDGMYMAEDGANIIVLTTAATGEIPSEEAITEQLKTTLGEETEITVDEYEVYKVGDYDALRFTASYLMEDMECTQTQCMVFADGKIGMAAFTQQKGGAWTDAFEECIESITME